MRYDTIYTNNVPTEFIFQIISSQEWSYQDCII